jgi:hypothetical protein
MTALLEKAIDRVSVLPPKQQNAFARLMLAELDADAQWSEAFAASQPELATLAGAALAEHHAGKTRKLSLAHDF